MYICFVNRQSVKVGFKSMKPKSIKFAGMTLREAQQYLIDELKKIYDAGEATKIAALVVENITGKKASAQSPNNTVTTEAKNRFEKYTEELASGRPVQYVLHEAWFAGMKFYVDENVLIPRPETEELVEWLVDVVKKSSSEDFSILDIGTGSGCIAVALAKKLPQCHISAIDISNLALSVATKNAQLNQVAVSFQQLDILNETNWAGLPLFDIVISNPPYIPVQDKSGMHINIVNFEPHVALFVPEKDPLIFYKALARFVKAKSSKIFAEISDRFAYETKNIFLNEGFSSAEVRNDINNNPRMIFAAL